MLAHIFRLARPTQLVLALLTYGLGVGIARYLGADLRLEPQLFGGLILLLLLAATDLLTEYFRPVNEPILPDETRKGREELRSILLIVSVAFIAVAAVLAFLLRWNDLLPVNAALLLVLYLILGLAVAVPPLRLANRGFGEIALAFLLAVLTPAIAFLLQAAELHRMLTLFTFPLFLLALAYFLAVDFPAYTEHLKYQRLTLLMRLTWQRAVPAHNGLLIAAYLFLSAAPFFQIPFSLIWPSLLTLPVAAYQIFMVRNIANGARPVWSALLVTATAVLGLTTYLLTLTFWLR